MSWGNCEFPMFASGNRGRVDVYDRAFEMLPGVNVLKNGWLSRFDHKRGWVEVMVPPSPGMPTDLLWQEFGITTHGDRGGVGVVRVTNLASRSSAVIGHGEEIVVGSPAMPLLCDSRPAVVVANDGGSIRAVLHSSWDGELPRLVLRRERWRLSPYDENSFDGLPDRMCAHRVKTEMMGFWERLGLRLKYGGQIPDGVMRGTLAEAVRARNIPDPLVVGAEAWGIAAEICKDSVEGNRGSEPMPNNLALLLGAALSTIWTIETKLLGEKRDELGLPVGNIDADLFTLRMRHPDILG